MKITEFSFMFSVQPRFFLYFFDFQYTFPTRQNWRIKKKQKTERKFAIWNVFIVGQDQNRISK